LIHQQFRNYHKKIIKARKVTAQIKAKGRMQRTFNLKKLTRFLLHLLINKTARQKIKNLKR